MQESNPTAQPRPLLVLILAILTILGAVTTYGYALVKLAAPEIAMNEVPLPAWIPITSFVLVAGKVVSAIFLLRMRKIGFYMYAAFESIFAIMVIVESKFQLDYMETGWVNPNIPFDPSFFVLLLAGVSSGLTIAFIGGHAAHLSKMR
ncbi:MAG: hypothetical protein U0176_00580 [Bacteroidia bacterium]